MEIEHGDDESSTQPKEVVTMTDPDASTRQRVVVGVDGTLASVQAIRYGRTEALRAHGSLEVVHVVPDYTPIAGVYPVPREDLVAAGRSTLESALAQVGPTAAAVPVETRVLCGSVVSSLVAAGEGARALVVGSDRRPVSMRLLTGNASTGVAARSSAPVVSVPETWRPDATTGVVLVGVKHIDQAHAPLAEAFDLARSRGSRLVVLHAWRLPSGYDDMIANHATLTDWDERARRELEKVVAPWRERRPEVDVEVRSVHDQPAHALVTASATADELVLVRRGHGFPAAAHLGSTARTVLLYAHCPVRVVSPEEE
jgi:nucleotide-binding universal stress UspA family protein